MKIIQRLEIEGNHQEVGLAVGRRFGDQIHQVFDNYRFLQERLLPFHDTSEGQDYYRAFLELHAAQFPGYVAELEGIAQGAERPLEEIFLVNLRGEYRGLMALGQLSEEAEGPGEVGCTDCLVLTPDTALAGHNEDGTPAALGKMFLLRAKVGERPDFTALCYPGFLPGNAFGFNASGVLHTIDAVSPRQVEVGLGRHFLARALLDACSLRDAIRRVTVPGQAAGFTYNIGSMSERRLVCVEVSPDRHHVHEVKGQYFHTNHYLHLADLPQTVGPSSRARLARAKALHDASPIADTTSVLGLLGDEGDCAYPIYRSASPPDPSATLCTALFDLDDRQLRIYAGHPVREGESCVTLAL
jgi:hypothetical protein